MGFFFFFFFKADLGVCYRFFGVWNWRIFVRLCAVLLIGLGVMWASVGVKCTSVCNCARVCIVQGVCVYVCKAMHVSMQMGACEHARGCVCSIKQ